MATSFDDIVLRATGRNSIEEAIDWLGQDYPLERDTDIRALIRALSRIDERSKSQQAIRQLTRKLATSNLDSARILFETDTIPATQDFRTSLDRLATLCPTGGLDSLTAKEVIIAQRADPFTVQALCAVAAVSYKELTERLPNLPTMVSGPFSPSQLRAVFDEFDRIVCGAETSGFPESVAARPIELMRTGANGIEGWQVVEGNRTNGIPYETLLIQREVGGAWLAHRNRTSGKVPSLLADLLCKELLQRDVAYARSTTIGGDVTPSHLAELTGCDKQVTLLVFDEQHSPCFGVIFSMARDSGTARSNATRLLNMRRRKDLAIAIVIAGPGWSKRNDTADLAVAFEGRLYSEASQVELLDEIQTYVSGSTKGVN